jgi:hypothetical protein
MRFQQASLAWDYDCGFFVMAKAEGGGQNARAMMPGCLCSACSFF